MLKTEEDIKQWLNKFNMGHYTINKSDDEFIVDVLGNVSINMCNLTHIPVQFGVVTESFFCQNNALTSLKGSPHTVGGSFNCSHNKLTTLEFAPTKVGKDFDCSNNSLVSLKGSPGETHEFAAQKNKLQSLEGGPRFVHGDYWCQDNELVSLKGAPERCLMLFCNNNKIKSLEHIQSLSALIIFNNELENLDNNIQNNIDVSFSSLQAYPELNRYLEGKEITLCAEFLKEVSKAKNLANKLTHDLILKDKKVVKHKI